MKCLSWSFDQIIQPHAPMTPLLVFFFDLPLIFSTPMELGAMDAVRTSLNFDVVLGVSDIAATGGSVAGGGLLTDALSRSGY
jgi:hypothetical protein